MLVICSFRQVISKNNKNSLVKSYFLIYFSLRGNVIGYKVDPEQDLSFSLDTQK